MFGAQRDRSAATAYVHQSRTPSSGNLPNRHPTAKSVDVVNASRILHEADEVELIEHRSWLTTSA